MPTKVAAALAALFIFFSPAINTSVSFAQAVNEEGPSFSRVSSRSKDSQRPPKINPCNYISRDLSLGMSDKTTKGEVSLLQRCLVDTKNLSSLEVTGVFDKKTEEGLKSLQHSMGNIRTGRMDSLTRSKIKERSLEFTATGSGATNDPTHPMPEWMSSCLSEKEGMDVSTCVQKHQGNKRRH